MPKRRYRIMRDYMPKKGKLGLDMMLRTCTVQANLDYQSEADMVQKFRVSLALQPVAVALFANSPFVEGKPTGYLELPQPRLDRYRSRPQRHAALRVRARLRLRALCRLHARRADVFRLSRRQLHRCRAGSRSAISSRAGCRHCPANCRAIGDWVGPSDHRIPRGAAQDASSRCAAPMAGRGAGSARCRRCGSGCSTTARRSTPPGISSRIGPKRSVKRCAATCRGWGSQRRSAAAPCATSRSKCWRSPAKGCSAARAASICGEDETHFLDTLFSIAGFGPHAGRRAARGFPDSLGAAKSTRSLPTTLIEIAPALELPSVNPTRPTAGRARASGCRRPSSKWVGLGACRSVFGEEILNPGFGSGKSRGPSSIPLQIRNSGSVSRALRRSGTGAPHRCRRARDREVLIVFTNSRSAQ